MKRLLLFLSIFLCFHTLYSQAEIEKVSSTITKEKIEGHIFFLADDLLKGRETGTPENKIAASYLANTLRGYGVKPVKQHLTNSDTKNYLQEVKLQKTAPPNKFSLTIGDKELENKVSIINNEIDFDGSAIYLGYGLESDYSGKNVSGKLVVLKSGGPDVTDPRASYGLISQKQKLAKEHGAIAVAELLNTDHNIWGFIDESFNSEKLEIETDVAKENLEKELPYIWVLDENHNYAKSLNSKDKLTGKLKLGAAEKSEVISQNVIGMIEGTDPVLKNEFIIYSAHYDHVGIGNPDATGDTIYNGARDNAVGTTTVLSMAENMAKYPTKRSALFILFTGEEKGLLGSRFYVENPALPLNKMVYCFNSDNAGYNDTSVITVIGLTRTTAEEDIKKAATSFGLTAIEDPAPEQNLFDRSDNVMFASKGIPAPTFSLGFRTFDGDVTKYYHQAGDEANTLDYDYLVKFFQSYVLAGRLIANNPKTPTWITNDKYEAAGKILYGN